MKFNELLESVLETEAEGEDALVATLKESGADEETINVAVANFRGLSGFKDKLSKEQFSIVAKAAGFEVEKAKKEEDEDEEDDGKFPFKSKKKNMKKSHVPADMPVEMKKAFDEQAAALEEVRKEAAESKSQLVTLQKDAQRKEYIAKCEADYSHVPGMSTDEMGEMLMKAYDADKDLGEAIEKSWKEASEAIKKSVLMGASGARHSSHDGASAMGKMEMIAKEYMAKDSSLTNDTAMAKVMEERGDLYTEYLNENPAQRGR